MKKNILYISYDGITDPLGYSQVYGYLERLSGEFKIYLISFEKQELKESPAFAELKRKAKGAGIVWFPLTYHKTPTVPATCFDVFQGLLYSIYIVLFHRVKIVHVRSYVAGLIGWVVRKIFCLPLLFDMRGFWADERVEGGLWKKERKIYRISKWFEKRFLLDAEVVVSLTFKGKEVLESFDYLKMRKMKIEVIPTCADLTRFFPKSEGRKFKGRLVVGYSGSVGLWYDFPATLRAFAAFKNASADLNPILLVLNKGEHDKIRTHFEDFGILEEDYFLYESTSNEMPYWINQMDLSVYFIRPSFSKQASSPTKLAEILGCGKSVITNDRVGDSGKLIRENRVGVLTLSFREDEIVKTVMDWLSLSKDPELSERCVEVARKYFSLESGVKAYQTIYNNM